MLCLKLLRASPAVAPRATCDAHFARDERTCAVGGTHTHTRRWLQRAIECVSAPEQRGLVNEAAALPRYNSEKNNEDVFDAWPK